MKYYTIVDEYGELCPQAILKSLPKEGEKDYGKMDVEEYVAINNKQLAKNKVEGRCRIAIVEIKEVI